MSATAKRQNRRTREQRAFQVEYHDLTLFEFLDDKTRPFDEVALSQIIWYEDHSDYAVRRLRRLLHEIAAKRVAAQGEQHDH